jgi:hypothetical protein
VAAGYLSGPDLARGALDPTFDEFVCGTGGPVRLHPQAGPLVDLCHREIARFRDLLGRYQWRPRRPIRRHCPCAPLWEPTWWNDGGQVQWNNNCYNYGTNYRSDTYAQPGQAAGAIYASITCADVRAGAVADKLIAVPRHGNRCPKEGHLVALVVGPGWDFHWYRRGRNGYWTHKPGGTQATDRDNSGNLIPDPRTADRGGYTDFCTFMIVMHGHIKIL